MNITRTLHKPKRSTRDLQLPPNNRHDWNSKLAARASKVQSAAIDFLFERDYSGLEKLPKDGAYIIGPTHQSMFDGPVATEAFPKGQPVAMLAAMDQFRAPYGKYMAATGAIPVDRFQRYDTKTPDLMEHVPELLNQGKPLLLYPEGKIYADDHVHPLKTGLARIAIKSDVEYVFPVAQHFSKSEPTSKGKKLLGGLLSAAIGVGTFAAMGAIPAVAGGVIGAVVGAVSGGAAGFFSARGDKAKGMKRALKGAGLGLVAGGIAGATLLATAVPGAILAGTVATASTATSLLVNRQLQNKKVAHMVVGDGIAVEPYRQRVRESEDPDAEFKEALKLTAVHHTALSEMKFELTGTEQRFRMDEQGQEWGLQPDGEWVRVERDSNKQWVPVQV